MQLTRNNRRKTTKARRTQVIDVPMYLIKQSLSNKDKELARKCYKPNERHLYLGTGFFELNKSKWAGKRKFIFHTPQAY